MIKQHLNPPTLFNSLQYGFSQIVASTGGTTVYLSGQVAWDAEQNIIGGDDLGEQTRQALRNVATGVETAGGALTDVVSLRIYIVARKLDDTSGISAALRDAFPPERPPATTWIGVPALARPEFLVEVEAIAVIG
jgi:enamine deaminase RidA (YjgF/YER057c/UK114 family)